MLTTFVSRGSRTFAMRFKNRTLTGDFVLCSFFMVLTFILGWYELSFSTVAIFSQGSLFGADSVEPEAASKLEVMNGAAFAGQLFHKSDQL